MRIRSFAVFLAAVLGALAVAQPARANISFVSLSTPQYTNLPCPTSIPVTAVVNGSPGQTFSATLTTNLGGVVQTIGPASATLLSTGTWAGYLSGGLPIQITASGSITYTASANGQSISKSIGVSCANAPGNRNGTDLGVPTNLSLVGSASACSQIFIDNLVDACRSAVEGNKVVLTWSFNPICAVVPCNVQDGWQIQRSTTGAGGPFTTVTTVAGPQARGSIVGDSISADVGECFQVLAYKGTSDVGRASNVTCVPQHLPVTLTPTKIQIAHGNVDSVYTNQTCYQPDSNPVGLKIGTDTKPNGPGITVGYLNRMTFYNGPAGQFLPCNSFDDVYQSVLTFDLTKLPSRAIASATLTLAVTRGAKNDDPGPVDGTKTGEDGTEVVSDVSCAVAAGFPTKFQTDSYGDLIGVLSDTAVKFGVATQSTLSVDLTGMVNTWLGPNGVNHGVVLSSSETSMPSPTNTECMTLYGNPQLTVTFKT